MMSVLKAYKMLVKMRFRIRKFQVSSDFNTKFLQRVRF